MLAEKPRHRVGGGVGFATLRKCARQDAEISGAQDVSGQKSQANAGGILGDLGGATVEWHVYPGIGHCWDCKQLDGISKLNVRGNRIDYRYLPDIRKIRQSCYSISYNRIGLGLLLGQISLVSRVQRDPSR